MSHAFFKTILLHLYCKCANGFFSLLTQRTLRGFFDSQSRLNPGGSDPLAGEGSFRELTIVNRA